MTTSPLSLDPTISPSGSCPRSYRTKALPSVALLCALVLFFAWWSSVDDALTEAPAPDRRAKVVGGGGTPGGADGAGSGPGAAAAGFDTGLASPDPDDKPLGDANTDMNQAAPIASGNDADETMRVLPRIGFTPPEEPPVKAPPVAPVLASPGGKGKGGRPGATGGSGTSFMGVETAAKRVVYILDFSGSMFSAQNHPKLDHVLLELKRSVTRLPTDHAFYIIFFDDLELPMPSPAMVAATAANKAHYFQWADVESVGDSARGGTDPAGAMRIALSTLNPDAIYLLTDGNFVPDETFAAISKFNASHAVEINTIGFHDQGGEATLRQIASENNGEYRYVAPVHAP